MLYKSIADDLQWFPEDDHEFYDRFVLYQLQTKQLTLDYNKAKSIFERESILPKGMVADIQIETLLSNYDYAKLALSKFKRETLVQLQNEINAIEEKLLSIDNSMNIVEENLRRCNIYASMSGILQESNTYHINDYLPSGIELSRIIPNEDAKLMTELFISNKDIALIMKGTTVNYRFAALPYDEYGSISGNIVEIPADISIRNTVNDFAYIVKASIDENAERNVKKSKDFRIGMLCEARIIVSEKRILTFVLEKLNFL
ncbi:MAG: HlyD family efflux transporter periplasmic adaptor subunit [Spirochaetales bacterium]|nr:HlyD family efflux transporter periplasmic adaptor subunit [Spirochaetales bacterium]